VFPKNKNGVVYYNVDHGVADNEGHGYDGYEQQQLGKTEKVVEAQVLARGHQGMMVKKR
jgi:hypothetical protein